MSEGDTLSITKTIVVILSLYKSYLKPFHINIGTEQMLPVCTVDLYFVTLQITSKGQCPASIESDVGCLPDKCVTFTDHMGFLST